MVAKTVVYLAGSSVGAKAGRMVGGSAGEWDTHLAGVLDCGRADLRAVRWE